MTLRLPDGRFVIEGNCFDLVSGELPETPEVSVVIPYFDAQRQLDLVLAALSSQTHPVTRLEVIVADDGSPEPPNVSAAQGVSVTVVSQERAGFRAAAARNAGASVAGGQVVCFLDGDTIPAPGFVAALTRLPAVLPDALVVGRREHADFSGWSPDRLRRWLAGEGDGPPALGLPGWLEEGYARSRNLLDADDRAFRYVISAVMCMDLEFFRMLGGFDGSFSTYGGEDWELAHRAWDAGAVLAHVPEALAWHDGPEWAARGGDRAVKNAETLELAGRIAQRQTRARHVVHARTAFVASVDNAGWSDAATVLTVDSLLALRDIAVYLTRPLRYLAVDPRVRTGEVHEAGSAVLRVAAPCVLDRFTVPRGRVVVADAHGPILEITATRAARRARRWASHFPGRDLVAELFGSDTVDAADAGVRRVDAEPDLAAYFASEAEDLP